MRRIKILLGVLNLLAGFAMICFCGVLIFRNETENTEAEQAVTEELPKLKEKIAEVTGDPENALYQQWLLGDAYVAPDSADADIAEEKSVIPLDGYSYIGYLSFPTLGTELPVMDSWDEVRLKRAPCRYYGSAETGDLVIAGHNYRSSFGLCKKLRVGDTVQFTNAAGIIRRYRVGEIEVVGPDAVDYMINSDWELSLYTCTYRGTQRLTIRCAEIRDGSGPMQTPQQNQA